MKREVQQAFRTQHGVHAPGRALSFSGTELAMMPKRPGDRIGCVTVMLVEALQDLHHRLRHAVELRRSGFPRVLTHRSSIADPLVLWARDRWIKQRTPDSSADVGVAGIASAIHVPTEANVPVTG